MERKFILALILGIILIGPIKGMFSKPENCGCCSPSIKIMSEQQPFDATDSSCPLDAATRPEKNVGSEQEPG